VKLRLKYYKILIISTLCFVHIAHAQNKTTNNFIYSAKDSILYDLNNNTVKLYKNAEVIYENIKLNAGFISIDFDENILFSTGILDSVGNRIEPPVFMENKKQYNADTIIYNYKSKKAKIKKLLTEEEGGYLHGKEIKKEGEKIYYLKNGRYTTCSLEHPHFFIHAKKIKLITGEQIITGPANLVLGEIPTPLFIPFGIFPIQAKRASGVILPTYGESTTLGYNLRDLGYYFSINDNISLSVNGDVYTRGSWRLGLTSKYKKRYKFDGDFKLHFSKTKIGEIERSDYSVSKDFKITWNHKQNPKAHPNNQFSALINLATSSYLRNNSYNADYLQNTLSSNISFQRRWDNKPYNLSINLRHNQNTLNKQVDLTLPELAFTVNRIFPFKNVIGKKYLQNFGFNYQLNAKNNLSAPDSLLFQNINQNIRSGIKHSIPVSTSFNVFKHINVSPSIQYNERWYFTKKMKNWNSDLGIMNSDTLTGFWAVRDYSFSTQFSTKIYGLISTKKKKFRHVLTPSIIYSYKPDFSQEKFGIYSEVDTDNGVEKYSHFEGSIYGIPGSTKQNLLNLSINNNLEMKVNKNGEEKKVKLIESLSIRGSYNNAADSLKMSPISINLRTKLFNKIDIKANSTIDPYSINQEGNRIDEFLVHSRQLGRLTNMNFNIGVNLTNPKKQKTSNLATEEQLEYINQNLDYFVDFTVPWSLRFFYNFTYNKPTFESDIIQTINFNGDLNITRKWKIGFRSGYDLKNKDFTYTSIDIYRDLHCWEMTFNWIPLGFHQSYNFVIRVKSSILQDLKLTKKRDFYDY